jgi:cysteine synthase A
VIRKDQPLSSAVEAIGNTPLVELSRLTKELDGRILAKLDYLNPGFQKRIALPGRLLKMQNPKVS